MNLIDFVVFISLFGGVFIVGETVIRLSRREYLKSKAKYLRELITQKNNIENPDREYYSCVFEKWDSGEMDISMASEACNLPKKFVSN